MPIKDRVRPEPDMNRFAEQVEPCLHISYNDHDHSGPLFLNRAYLKRV